MNEIYLIVGGIISAAAALIAGWFTVRQSGKKAERNEQLKRDTDAKRKADEADKKMDALSADDIRDRGRKWLRNK